MEIIITIPINIEFDIIIFISFAITIKLLFLYYVTIRESLHHGMEKINHN